MRKSNLFYSGNTGRHEKTSWTPLIGFAALLMTAMFIFTGCPTEIEEDPPTPPALTGTVSITGTEEVGQTLTANTSALGGSGAITYQWKRGDSAATVNTSIAGATSETYLLAAADRGKYITVTVSRAGHSSSVTSSATAQVELPALTPAIISNASELSAYIGRLDGTEQEPATIEFSGDITAFDLATVREAVNTANTYVIWDLSEISNSLYAWDINDIGNTIDEDSDTGRDKIKGLVLPESLTSIGDEAFWGCKSLASITLPASLTEIRERTFSGCSSLASITLPASLTKIGWSAFGICKSLASITLPASLTEIGDDAFLGCSSLTSVEFEGTSVTIGSSAFPPMNDNNLKTAYETGKEGTNKGVAGIYTRDETGNYAGTWSRQQ